MNLNSLRNTTEYHLSKTVILFYDNFMICISLFSARVVVVSRSLSRAIIQAGGRGLLYKNDGVLAVPFTVLKYKMATGQSYRVSF